MLIGSNSSLVKPRDPKHIFIFFSRLRVRYGVTDNGVPLAEPHYYPNHMTRPLFTLVEDCATGKQANPLQGWNNATMVTVAEGNGLRTG